MSDEEVKQNNEEMKFKGMDPKDIHNQDGRLLTDEEKDKLQKQLDVYVCTVGGWVATQHLHRIQAMEAFAKHIDKYVFALEERVKKLESYHESTAILPWVKEDSKTEETKEEETEIKKEDWVHAGQWEATKEEDSENKEP